MALEIKGKWVSTSLPSFPGKFINLYRICTTYLEHKDILEVFYVYYLLLDSSCLVLFF